MSTDTRGGREEEQRNAMIQFWETTKAAHMALRDVLNIINEAWNSTVKVEPWDLYKVNNTVDLSSLSDDVAKRVYVLLKKAECAYEHAVSTLYDIPDTKLRLYFKVARAAMDLQPCLRSFAYRVAKLPIFELPNLSPIIFGDSERIERAINPIIIASRIAWIEQGMRIGRDLYRPNCHRYLPLVEDPKCLESHLSEQYKYLLHLDRGSTYIDRLRDRPNDWEIFLTLVGYLTLSRVEFNRTLEMIRKTLMNADNEQNSNTLPPIGTFAKVATEEAVASGPQFCTNIRPWVTGHPM